MQNASIDSNPSSPASNDRKEASATTTMTTTTTTKGRRKQSYPSKAPTSPDIANYQHEHDEQAQDFTAWSNKIKGKVCTYFLHVRSIRRI